MGESLCHESLCPSNASRPRSGLGNRGRGDFREHTGASILPQLMCRRSESAGVDSRMGTVTRTDTIAAKPSGAIWVYFGLQVCFSKIPTPVVRAIWNGAVVDQTNR